MLCEASRLRRDFDTPAHGFEYVLYKMPLTRSLSVYREPLACGQARASRYGMHPWVWVFLSLFLMISPFRITMNKHLSRKLCIEFLYGGRWTSGYLCIAYRRRLILCFGLHFTSTVFVFGQILGMYMAVCTLRYKLSDGIRQ